MKNQDTDSSDKQANAEIEGHRQEEAEAARHLSPMMPQQAPGLYPHMPVVPMMMARVSGEPKSKRVAQYLGDDLVEALNE